MVLWVIARAHATANSFGVFDVNVGSSRFLAALIASKWQVTQFE
jgi:hypothetical protein